MNFDSSLYDSLYDSLDKKLSPVEYKDHLVSLLQPILDKRFADEPAKQKIYVKHNRINFSCPYCGDSMTNPYKKRGNIILDGKFKNYYKCHNCDTFKRVDKFFKDFGQELELGAINYIVDTVNDFSGIATAKYDISALLDVEPIETHAIDKKTLMKSFGLVDVRTSPIKRWLDGRRQFSYDKFLYNPQKDYLLVLNLTKSGKVLGAQKRVFRGPNKYITLRLSKLWELLEKPLSLSEEGMDRLNTLSMMFNICLVDFTKPITLFEGPLDSFLFKNSIANTGANKTLPVDIPVRYLYDYDETGRRKSLEHINNGEPVFLWAKFLRDFCMPYRKKYDWNDVVMFAHKHNKSLPYSISNYFSSDPLDSIDI